MNKSLFYFIGIGGIGMSALAFLMKKQGHEVVGSDQQSNTIIEKLKNKGVKVYIGHIAEHVPEEAIVVVSSAITSNNCELKIAIKRKQKILKRAELLAQIVNFGYGVTVAGAHGKTTTSSLLTHILHDAGFDHTAIIGGWVESLNGNYRLGSPETIIAEADESDGSFLLYNSQMGLITNIDSDHMEYFKTEDKLISDFEKYANNVSDKLIVNGDDPRLIQLSVRAKKMSVGFADHNDLRIEIQTRDSKGSGFKLASDTIFYVPLIGDHNVQNAALAVVAARYFIKDDLIIAKALASFKGVKGRQEKIFENDQLLVIEDYAHHPHELSKTIESYQQHYRNVSIVYQPHRYSRLRETFSDHVNLFKNMDSVYILPVYSAGEPESPDINSLKLVEQLDNDGVQYIENINQREWHKNSGILIFLGAGNIGKLAREYFEKSNL